MIALYVHPKNSNYLRSHLRARALDHSRLGLENKFLESKSGRIFLRSTSLLYEILPTSLGTCYPTLNFLYITSEVKQYHEALSLSYRPRSECSISQFCNTNCTHSIFRTIEARVGFLAKPFKKFPKSPIRLVSSHFWQAPKSTV